MSCSVARTPGARVRAFPQTKICAPLLDQIPGLVLVGEQFVLRVLPSAVRLTGERRVHLQPAPTLELFQFVDIQPIGRRAAAEEQQRRGQRGTAGPLFSPFLQESAERGQPVPAPTMIIGTDGSAGGRKGMVGCRVNTKTVLPGSIDCR